MFLHTNPFAGIKLLIILAFMGLHCEHVGPFEAEPVNNNEAPTLTSIQGIFTTNCAISGCHTGPNALMGLDLSEGNAHKSLVGVPSKEAPSLHIVSASAPENSYLILKLEGGSGMAAGTMIMPVGRPPLKDEDINKIRAWIADGAQDN